MIYSRYFEIRIILLENFQNTIFRELLCFHLELCRKYNEFWPVFLSNEKVVVLKVRKIKIFYFSENRESSFQNRMTKILEQ